MTLTAAINHMVPLNLLLPHQRVICPHSPQSAKYRIVTHNFTNDDLNNGNSPSYHWSLWFFLPVIRGLPNHLHFQILFYFTWPMKLWEEQNCLNMPPKTSQHQIENFRNHRAAFYFELISIESTWITYKDSCADASKYCDLNSIPSPYRTELILWSGAFFSHFYWLKLVWCARVIFQCL